MKRNFLIVLFGFFLLFPNLLFAQDGIVKGFVADENGVGMPGVSVVLKGTTKGLATDVDGNFSFVNLPKDGILVFSFIGYLKQTIDFSGNQALKVVLKEDMEALEEIIVIGYGTARKSDLTGAISTIKAESLIAEAGRSIQDLMRANIPGLNIKMSTSAKGGGDIQIRGKNTLKAGSAPLLVLDGVIYEGSLSDINPMDISSINILKDASSAAVYGAKASNGVVAITTKKGKTGKPLISFNVNAGLVTSANQPDILDENGFLQFRQDYTIGKNSDEYLAKYPDMFIDPRLTNVDPLVWYNYDQATPVASVTEEQLLRAWATRLNLTSEETDNFIAGNITKWDDLVFQVGLQQDYTISMSNRKEDVSYYWSMAYSDREGIIVGDEHKTLRTRLNLESKITDFLTVGANASFASRDESSIPVTWEEMIKISPYGANHIGDSESDYELHPTGDVTPKNPFYEAAYQDRKKYYHTFNANMFTKIKLPFGIEYQMNFTPHYEWHEYYNHKSSKSDEWAASGGSSERTTKKIFNWQVDNVLRWKKEFNELHNLEVTLLANAEKGQNWEQKAKNSGYAPSDVLGYHRLQAGTVPLVESNDNYRTGDALMARLFYSFNNRYMFTASVRRDGYSAFGITNPRATFPSLAVAWTFTSEDFMESTASWLDYGKLRVSWGENGNRAIGQYQALSDMSSGPHPYIDQNGNIYLTSQLYVNRMSNSGLKWERTASLNFGLDFSLFSNVLSGTLDAYVATTNDLLVDRALPEIIGFASVATNLGQLQNRGLELSLNATIIDRENFAWNTSGSFSLNRRELKELYGDMEDVLDEDGNVIGQKESDDIKNKWFIGQDPDRIWSYEGDGVWQQDEMEEADKYGMSAGDFKFIDQNGDGVMTNDDKVFQGYTTPRFNWTLRNEFTFFKDISLSFLLYSNWGHYGTFNTAANTNNFPDRCSNYDLPRWTKDNPINDFGRIDSKRIADHYVNKSFIRLENIALSYNMPKEFLNKIMVQNMSFSLSVRNVAVFAPHWKYWDPENGSLSPRTFNLGINFTL